MSILFSDSQVYLFIAMQVHETVSDCDVIPESNEHTGTVLYKQFESERHNSLFWHNVEG